MSNQIRVLYTEQKTKKVKIWLDGYLIPQPTLNSARLISAGKHEIDVVFYSSIDEIQPGREFETDRYLISVEEPIDNNQPCPRPSYAVNDPTMKNRPKSAAFVPPRMVPRPEPPPPPPQPQLMSTFERSSPYQWGYAGMTPSMKRSAYEDESETNLNHPAKIAKTSSFIPPTFQRREEISEVPSRPTPPIQQTNSSDETAISRVFKKPCSPPPPSSPPQSKKPSPVKQAPLISWSAWDDGDLDAEEPPPNPPAITSIENLEQMPSSKQTISWENLFKSVNKTRATNNENKTSEAMPKFNFDDSAFDTLFDDLDD